MGGKRATRQAEAEEAEQRAEELRALLRSELRDLLQEAPEAQQPQRQPAAFSAEELGQLSGKPGLKAQAELAASVLSHASSALEALERCDEEAAREQIAAGEAPAGVVERGRRRRADAGRAWGYTPHC